MITSSNTEINNSNTPLPNPNKYSLKFVLISNFCSFFIGLVAHYITGGHYN